MIIIGLLGIPTEVLWSRRNKILSYSLIHFLFFFFFRSTNLHISRILLPHRGSVNCWDRLKPLKERIFKSSSITRTTMTTRDWLTHWIVQFKWKICWKYTTESAIFVIYYIPKSTNWPSEISTATTNVTRRYI